MTRERVFNCKNRELIVKMGLKWEKEWAVVVYGGIIYLQENRNSQKEEEVANFRSIVPQKRKNEASVKGRPHIPVSKMILFE